MKRMTLLTALAVSVVMGASVSASANDRQDKSTRESQYSNSRREHQHGNRRSESSVCRMATDYRARTWAQRTRVRKLQHHYNHDLAERGARHLHKSKHRLDRAKNELRKLRHQTQRYERKCEVAKYRRGRRYRNSYSYNYWSN